MEDVLHLGNMSIRLLCSCDYSLLRENLLSARCRQRNLNENQWGKWRSHCVFFLEVRKGVDVISPSPPIPLCRIWGTKYKAQGQEVMRTPFHLFMSTDLRPPFLIKKGEIRDR